MTNSIVISSGHGQYIRGASGYLDEVNEARRVTERVAEFLRGGGVTVKTFHDNTSHDQGTNLNAIVNYHNKQSRELDVSVHFNAYQTTSKPMGVECLYKTQEALADKVSAGIAAAGDFLDRGPKYRSDLKFLNSTNKPAILIEVCFVDSKADEGLYNQHFDPICEAIAQTIAGRELGVPPIEPPPTEELPPPIEEIPPHERPTIAKGDEGEAVMSVQRSLGVEADGDFGGITDGAVRGYQSAAGLAADGVVGPKTWAALDEFDAAKAAGNDGIPPEQISRIVEIAESSAIARYSWRDRGVAPKGYTAGVALCFALAATKLLDDHPTAQVMAQGDRNNPDKDALSWYRSKFEAIGMDNSEDGIDTLRGLFVMLLGLGLRESSGRYCEGRDMSADNVSAETAEAGAWQTSWNIRSCSSYIPPLLTYYWVDPNGFLTQFQNGVSPKSDELGNYGSGDGAKYQFLSKTAPAFHAFVTAIGMRYLRAHWGPINRNEVEIRSEANDMLMDVQNFLSEGAAEAVAYAGR